MTTEPKAEGGCTDVEVLRDILGDHPLPPRQREAVESAIRSMKAEGGEAVGEVYTHVVPEDWGRYPEMRSARVKFYGDAPPAGTKLYTHPTTPAVEALARAALELGDANFAEYCGEGTESMEPDDSKVSYPEERCSITFGMIRRIRLALANPEIAALLKGEKK